MDGWVKVYRSLQDHWMWADEPYDKARAWIDLIMLAAFTDSKAMCKGRTVDIKRGDVNWSIKALATRWHWSRHKVSDYLDLLEKDNMIVQKRTCTRTVIKIVNYELYQGIVDMSLEGKRTLEGTSEITNSGHQKDTYKKEKKNTYNNYLSLKGGCSREDIEKWEET